MSHPLPSRRLTPEEYLAFEEAAPTKHEYVAGEVYAMSGVRRGHAKIVRNVSFLLHTAARGGSCDVITTDVKLGVGRDRFYYPDVMVVCTPGPDDELVIRDPCLVVEVTSPSTARIDRGEKRDAYLGLPPLRAYLVVDHRRRRVQWWARDGADAPWRDGEAVDGAIDVPCPATALSLDEIYEGLQLLAVGEDEAPEYETADA